MPIPDYQTLMLPVLRIASDGEEHRFRDAIETLAEQFQLTDEERREMLPSGGATLFDNRVGWARTYLKQAGCLESRKRGVFRITERGQALLGQSPESIDVQLLDQFPEFREFRSRRRGGTRQAQPAVTVPLERESEYLETPEEGLAGAYRRLRSELESELYEQIMGSSPAFFERLVIDLLVGMGYGGNRQDAGNAIGRSGDGGIDGIIKEDRLGLDVIYVQAKRWENTVGRPEIQRFAGALQGQRARKGVFITTAGFSREAIDYANSIDSKIILIDGTRLVGLMVDHNVGVSTTGVYEIKRVDSDYFDGE